MEYTITANTAHHGIEIAFDARPSVAVRDALKALKMRWHGVKKCWYGRVTEDAARAAIDGADNGETETTTTETAKPAPAEAQNHIKIYWNGIKLDGGKLIRCGYSTETGAESPCVTIYARSYGDDLPRDLLPVKNGSDSMTDYFEKDRASITPDHPLYKFFRWAALKARARDDAKRADYIRGELNRPEPWRGHHDALKIELDSLTRRNAKFESMRDPGQPTAADLAAIDSAIQEAENARREAEHEAELQHREEVLRETKAGRDLIDAMTDEYPITQNAPIVTIEWSEHPAFYGYDDGALKLSVAAADKILGMLDFNCRHKGGYYKTSFSITGKDLDGEPINYKGRYDIGDGENGLIQHIRNFGEYMRTHDDHGNPLDNPEEITDLLKFADYLTQISA